MFMNLVHIIIVPRFLILWHSNNSETFTGTVIIVYNCALLILTMTHTELIHTRKLIDIIWKTTTVPSVVSKFGGNLCMNTINGSP